MLFCKFRKKEKMKDIQCWRCLGWLSLKTPTLFFQARALGHKMLPFSFFLVDDMVHRSLDILIFFEQTICLDFKPDKNKTLEFFNTMYFQRDFNFHRCTTTKKLLYFPLFRLRNVGGKVLHSPLNYTILEPPFLAWLACVRVSLLLTTLQFSPTFRTDFFLGATLCGNIFQLGARFTLK